MEQTFWAARACKAPLGMQYLLAMDELSSVKVFLCVRCKSAPSKFIHQCCVQFGASLCLLFENTGQRKVIYSKGFLVLTFEQSSVLVFENQRETRGRLGCSKETKSHTTVELLPAHGWGDGSAAGVSTLFPQTGAWDHLHDSDVSTEWVTIVFPSVDITDLFWLVFV